MKCGREPISPFSLLIAEQSLKKKKLKYAAQGYIQACKKFFTKVILKIRAVSYSIKFFYVFIEKNIFMHRFDFFNL